MLPETALPHLSTSCTDLDPSPAFLVDLIDRCWTLKDWALLLHCMSHDTPIQPDLQDVTVYRTSYASNGASLLVFPDMHVLARQFVRVMEMFASVEEPVSPDGFYFFIRIP